MVQFDYGPADVFVIRYRGTMPDPAVLRALEELVDAETVRLLDILVVSADESGTTTVFEIDDLPGADESRPIELAAPGITGSDDIDEIAADLEPGTSAAIAVIEQLWAKSLAERFAESGSELIGSVRIPAPELNAVAAAAHID